MDTTRATLQKSLVALVWALLSGLAVAGCGAGQGGRVIWKIPGELVTGRDGRVYIQDLDSPSNALSRLDLAEGKRLWTAGAQGQLTPECTYADVLVTAAEGRVQGLDAETGRALWTAADEVLAGDGTPRLACPESGSAFYAVRLVGTNALVAFSKNAGRSLWRYDPGGYVAVADADAELVFVDRGMGGPDALVALDATTGAVRWSVPADGGQPRISVHGGAPFMATGGTLAELDRATGAVVWSSSLGDGPFEARFEGDAILVSSEHREARLDPATGKPLWEREIAAGGEKRLEDDRGGVYRLRANRDFSRLDETSGDSLWSTPIGVFGELLGADEEAIYLTLLDVGPQVRTTAVALDRENGRELWRLDLRAAARFVAEDADRFYFTTTSPEGGTISVAVAKR